MCESLTDFAQRVSTLADRPSSVIDLCPDPDLRDCARVLKAARAVAAANYRMAKEAEAR